MKKLSEFCSYSLMMHIYIIQKKIHPFLNKKNPAWISCLVHWSPWSLWKNGKFWYLAAIYISTLLIHKIPNSIIQYSGGHCTPTNWFKWAHNLQPFRMLLGKNKGLFGFHFGLMSFIVPCHIIDMTWPNIKDEAWSTFEDETQSYHWD